MNAPAVWHLRSSAGLYGAEHMLLDLCAEQRRRGLRPVLSAFAPSGLSAPALINAANQRGIDARVVLCRGKLDLRCLRSLRAQLIAAGRDDARGGVLHCHDYKSVLYGWLGSVGLGLRRVATVHGWVDDSFRAHLYRVLEMQVLRTFHRVCAVSERIAVQLRQAGVRQSRLQRVDNGIDLLRFRLRPKSSAERPLQLGTAARLSPEKNLVQLITAVADCRARGVAIQLTILGEGPQRTELEALIARLELGDCIALPGARDALETWYPQLDAFVLPSLSEGMPLTVLEALACGCPVVASDVGALSTVLESLPGCRIVPVADQLALTDALCALTPGTEPDARLRQRVIDRYSASRMADAYDDVYRHAVAA